MLHYLAAELNKCIYISKLTISDSTITIDAGRFNEGIVHHFGKRELNFLLKYLPENMIFTDERFINY
jgi:hypothetical protein